MCTGALTTLMTPKRNPYTKNVSSLQRNSNSENGALTTITLTGTETVTPEKEKRIGELKVGQLKKGDDSDTESDSDSGLLTDESPVVTMLDATSNKTYKITDMEFIHDIGVYDNMTQYYRETLFGEIVHGMLYEPDVNEYSHDSMVYMLT